MMIGYDVPAMVLIESLGAGVVDRREACFFRGVDNMKAWRWALEKETNAFVFVLSPLGLCSAVG